MPPLRAKLARSPGRAAKAQRPRLPFSAFLHSSTLLPAEQSANMMNGGKIMDKPLVTIKYKTANGNEICVEVSTPVKELLEQSDRQIRTQRRQDRRHLDYVDFIDGLTDTAMMNPQEDIADLVIRMESYKQLYTAINQLSEIQRRNINAYQKGKTGRIFSNI